MPITIVYGSQRRTATFTPSPGVTISSLVQQAVEKFKLPTEGREYEIIYQNKPVDVSLPFRLSKIPQTATLELQIKKKNTKKIVPCKIAVQLPTGKRITGEFPSTASLWDILLHFQLEAGLNLTIDEEKPFLEPEIMFLQRKFKKFSELKNSTLSSISASGGLLRLSVTPTGKSLGEIMEASPDFPVPTPPPSPSPSIIEEPLPERQEPVSKLPEPQTSPSGPQTVASTNETNKIQENLEKTTGEEQKEVKTEEKMEIVENSGQLDATPVEKGENLPEKMEIDSGKNENKKENVEKIEENRKDVEMEETGPAETKTEASVPEKPRKKLEKKEIEKKVEKKSKFEVELEPMIVPEREIKFFEKQTAKQKLPASQESDDVFNLTAADLKGLKVKAAGPVPPLERENHRRKTINTFRIVKLKVKFPNGTKMEGFFEIRETVGDVMNVLQNYLAFQDKEFHLFVIPPKKVLEPKSSLYDEKLFPAAEIHFGWNEAGVREYLRSDIVFSIPEVKLPQLPESGGNQENKQENKNERTAGGNKPKSATSATSKSAKGGGPAWFLAGKRS